jgi:hypothetical protein
VRDTCRLHDDDGGIMPNNSLIDEQVRALKRRVRRFRANHRLFMPWSSFPG